MGGRWKIKIDTFFSTINNQEKHPARFPFNLYHTHTHTYPYNETEKPVSSLDSQKKPSHPLDTKPFPSDKTHKRQSSRHAASSRVHNIPTHGSLSRAQKSVPYILYTRAPPGQTKESCLLLRAYVYTQKSRGVHHPRVCTHTLNRGAKGSSCCTRGPAVYASPPSRI